MAVVAAAVETGPSPPMGARFTLADISLHTPDTICMGPTSVSLAHSQSCGRVVRLCYIVLFDIDSSFMEIGYRFDWRLGKGVVLSNYVIELKWI